MQLDEFKSSLGRKDAPGLSKALQALWWDGIGDWQKAHSLCQEAGSQEGDWVHAYLHRKEGDESNASYWYQRCGKSKPKCALEEEWAAIAEDLLARE